MNVELSVEEISAQSYIQGIRELFETDPRREHFVLAIMADGPNEACFRQGKSGCTGFGLPRKSHSVRLSDKARQVRT